MPTLDPARLRPIAALLLGLGLCLVPATARGADTWSEVAPGIQKLYRDTGSQKIHAVIVDLARPELFVRATRPGEGNRTTSSFAGLVGATVAINGDWFASGTPHGLAVGAGEPWDGTADVDWAFLACTFEKSCHIDTSGQNQALQPRWHDVVGGNGALLVVDGAVQHRSEAFYATDRHPRSAVGLSANGQTLILVAVQGRRTDSAGMTFNEVASLMVELGADDAMMFDGGGSTTLVVGGARANALPSGQSTERTVANHLAVMRVPSGDGRCQVANGRFCLDADRIAGCQGGGHYGDGDCSVFGASCHVTDGIGYCAQYQCQRPHGTFCVDGAILGTCEYGRFSEGDCSFFGASCEDDGQSGYCVHPFCTEGGNATWCSSETVRATCVRGAWSEEDCAAQGLVCVPAAGSASCAAPVTPPMDTAPADTAPEDTSPAGDTGADAGDLVGDGDTQPTDTDSDTSSSAPDADMPGSDDTASGQEVDAAEPTPAEDLPPLSDCACASVMVAGRAAGGAPALAALLALGLLGLTRRGRRRAAGARRR